MTNLQLLNGPSNTLVYTLYTLVEHPNNNLSVTTKFFHEPLFYRKGTLPTQ